MKNDKVTISDIAEALGVSTISVSRALSGQTGVSEELRNKIIHKAKEMGYLKAKKSDQVHILVLHQKPFIQDNSNFSSMVQGIETNIQKAEAEYSVEYVDKANQDMMYLPHKLTKGKNFDGVIFIGGFNDAYIQFIGKKIKNLLIFNGYSPALTCDSVGFDFMHIGYTQCKHLIEKGHKSISFIGNMDNFKNKEKVLGIQTALQDYGLPQNENFVINFHDNLDAKVTELLCRENRPSAFICQWDFTAIQLIKMLYEKNIRVPVDMSIVSSGNSEMSLLAMPALTSIDLNIEYACQSAVDLLLKRIHQPDKPSENILIHGTLIERDSVKNR